MQKQQPERRARRVKLAGSVLVLICFENGRQLTAKLHQLSATGGLVHVTKPVDEGIKVELVFHIGATIRTRATMLFPMWATQGCLQPFQFCELEESDRKQLESHLHQFLSPTEAAAQSASS
ncbi:MAG TPA: hypothetical protein VH437_12295 [Terriglobales bacterium]